MLLIAFGWIYVVLMVSLVQATGGQGTLIGAVITFAFYGLLPVGILVYLSLSPARRRKNRALEASERQAAHTSGAALDPDGGRHAPGDPVAPEGKEP